MTKLSEKSLMGVVG